MHSLDNPIWSALTSRHSNLAEGDEQARRYPAIFTTLAAVREPSVISFESLRKVTKDSENLALCFSDEAWVPPDWECRVTFAVTQMVCEKLIDCKSHEMEVLTTADVGQMKALVKLTQPGPFSDRTIEFGTFLGVKDGAKLVAMAGERMKIEGDFDEVSAVCTHPDYQGRGYARALTHAVAKRIYETGHTPILHVRSDNLAGIRSYESIGFVARRQFCFAVVRPRIEASSN